MLAPNLRNQINQLWTLFWSSGMTNPLTAIEQITYLIFLKQLEAQDNRRDKEARDAGLPYRSLYGARTDGCTLNHHANDAEGDPIGRCIGHHTVRWSYILQEQESERPALFSDFVFPWLRVLEQTLAPRGSNANGLRDSGRRMEDAYFQLSSNKSGTLQRAMGIIDGLLERSASYDLMGDIFEHLLSEIQTSGKNGQFRTPRHIIRVMIELLKPAVGSRVLDPAAGTAGFLINTLLYWQSELTDKETLVREWDGTPHRLYPTYPDGFNETTLGQGLVGFDNDRTMARIGWMNMILHGVPTPHIELQDALSQNLTLSDAPASSDTEQKLHEYLRFDYALANPPFTGTVDTPDLSQELQRFAGGTNKSELLFIGLILDALKQGGRAAVIVPEGVLFGSTNAHRSLRRTLLFDHRVEAVISLPAGTFLPYTGVKTSILIFQKYATPRTAEEPPRTTNVWFYEVRGDGYSLDAKRSERPLENDLWDLRYKFVERGDSVASYHRPEFYEERWRAVDAETLQIFPELDLYKDKEPYAIHELFPQLPRAPQAAQEQIEAETAIPLITLIADYRAALRARNLSDAAFKRELRLLTNKMETLSKSLFLRKESGFTEYGREAFLTLWKSLYQTVDAQEELPASSESVETWEADLERIMREFARLDGYAVRVRSPELYPFPKDEEPRMWSAAVRHWARNDSWVSADGSLHGSHDEQGQIRPDYLRDSKLYDEKGQVRRDYLVPGCIEANDLNLSAGRYKPFAFSTADVGDPLQILDTITALEHEILERLTRLRKMVGEGE